MLKVVNASDLSLDIRGVFIHFVCGVVVVCLQKLLVHRAVMMVTLAGMEIKRDKRVRSMSAKTSLPFLVGFRLRR